MKNKIPQKIVPFLWFDDKAEEAAKFYTGIFKNAKIEQSSPMSATFNLDGVEFIALNGGPMFTFSPAISFFVRCKTQAEIDYYWDRLSKGGEKQKCGWLKDKFGISWQIIPPILGELLSSEDEATSQRAMQAMLKMTKIDIQALKAAAKSR